MPVHVSWRGLLRLLTLLLFVAVATGPLCTTLALAAPLAQSGPAAVDTTTTTTTTTAAPLFRRSLFTDFPSVVDIGSTNFSALRHGSPAPARCPWLVLFYSSGCGHCRSTAPKFALFASTLHARPDNGEHVAAAAVIQGVPIAALNCEDAFGECRKHKVRFVPVLRLFLPELPGGPTADSATAAATPGFTSVVLSVRGKDSALSQLGLDLQEQLDKHAALLPGGQFSPALIEQCVDLRNFLEREKHERLHPTDVDRDGAVKAAPLAAASTAEAFRETRELFATDIANAFFFTLHHEVSLVGFDNRTQYLALKHFLQVVDEALPGLNAGVMLHYLKSKAIAAAAVEAALAATRDPTAASAPAGSTLTLRSNVTEWKGVVLRAGIPIAGTPRQLLWRTCRGSAWKYRGFPCGMWLLYHSLAANYEELQTTEPLDAVAPYRKSEQTKRSRKPRRMAGTKRLEVLHVILNYVREYFSCEDCRNHFLHFKPLPGPTTARSASLQLWRVHNIANRNLMNVTAGADPLVPKRIFPDAALCPACAPGHAAHAHRTNKAGGVDGDANFDEDAVAAFLAQRYVWDPTQLRGEQTSARPPAALAAGQGDGAETVMVHRDPLGLNVFLTMTAVSVFVGLGCCRVLRKNRAGHRIRRKTMLSPLFGVSEHQH